MCPTHRWLITVDADQQGAVQEIRERPPPMLNTLMAGPLGGDAGDLGAPTTYVEHVDDGPPWEV
jgi:hypothetical protein